MFRGIFFLCQEHISLDFPEIIDGRFDNLGIIGHMITCFLM